jgi:hypothetical protein
MVLVWAVMIAVNVLSTIKYICSVHSNLNKLDICGCFFKGYGYGV